MSRKHRQRGKRAKRAWLNFAFGITVICACLVACVIILMPGRLWTSGDPISTTQTPAPNAELPAESGESSDPLPSFQPTPSPSPTPKPTPVPTPVIHEYPYYVVVDRGKQVVTVYTVDENGDYKHVVREMICSTDMYNRKPPNGVYRLEGDRYLWRSTVSTPVTHVQYATRIASKILFHSIPYKKNKNPSTLDVKAYKELGTNASIGCIRLLCEDAKWIFDNIKKGTPVKFITTERDEALLQRLAPPPLQSEKWDPTDPDPKNPDYDPLPAKPEVTPWLGVTLRPTASWKPAKYK